MAETVKELTDAKIIAEHTARILMSASQYPEFRQGSVPVAVAAEVFGKDATWVQAGIIGGWLPIGKATVEKQQITCIADIPKGKKTNFYISPKLLWEITGYVWGGKNQENNSELGKGDPPCQD